MELISLAACSLKPCFSAKPIAGNVSTNKDMARLSTKAFPIILRISTKLRPDTKPVITPAMRTMSKASTLNTNPTTTIKIPISLITHAHPISHNLHLERMKHVDDFTLAQNSITKRYLNVKYQHASTPP